MNDNSIVVGDEDRKTEGAGSEGWPSEQWRAAWASQDTPKFRRVVRRYAERRAYGVGKSGGRTDTTFVDELVADMIADTWIGRLLWDPQRVTLLQHVTAGIRSRTTVMQKRLARRRHVSADLDDDSDADAKELEESLRAHRGSSTPDEQLSAAELVAKVRLLSKSDRDVAALVEAYCAGARGRLDAIEATDMPARAHDAVRKRLDAILDDLPQSEARLSSPRRRRRETKKLA